MIRRTKMFRTASSSEFTAIGYGSDARSVFRELVQDAQDDYGSRGNTGTIAEKDSYRIVAEPMTQGQAYKYADQHISEYDKYGPAGCIPIVDSKVVAQKEFEVKVKAKTREEAMNIVSEQLKTGQKRAGTTIEVNFTNVTMTTPASKGTVDGSPSTVGTKYMIEGWEAHPRKFSTKKEAIEHYMAFAGSPSWDNRPCTLVKLESLTVLSYVPSAKLPTFTLKGKRVQVVLDTKIKGFLFFGWAAD